MNTTPVVTLPRGIAEESIASLWRHALAYHGERRFLSAYAKASAALAMCAACEDAGAKLGATRAALASFREDVRAAGLESDSRLAVHFARIDSSMGVA